MDERADAAYAAVAALIDHTLLAPGTTAAQIEQLCREAWEFGFAAVCVNPVHVAHCAQLLRGARAVVCGVVGFPLGATLPEIKRHEARLVTAAGGREVDAVIDIGALKDGDPDRVRRDLDAIVTACREAGAVSKIIIEAALLTDDEKVAACRMAQEAGADYVKTSTGFGPGGATVADVALMRRTVGPTMGVKASGGIRDLTALDAMVRAGATRIGTSAGVTIAREAARITRRT